VVERPVIAPLRARLAEGLRRRLDVRLHPLLALGVGLGLAALLAPGGALEEERHSQEEILARLLLEEPDLEHAPPFWLAERRRDSPLWRRALALCSAPENLPHPNCRVLRLLEDLAAPAAPETPAPLPQEPPHSEEDR
jgi:hypothetical protein